uniref:Candidate secreted effector n=1 Tax=Meloidogyne incognita TaxID=6306 RepID=A0A914NE08_MELIC
MSTLSWPLKVLMAAKRFIPIGNIFKIDLNIGSCSSLSPSLLLLPIFSLNRFHLLILRNIFIRIRLFSRCLSFLLRRLFSLFLLCRLIFLIITTRSIILRFVRFSLPLVAVLCRWRLVICARITVRILLSSLLAFLNFKLENLLNSKKNIPLEQAS